MSRLNDFLLGIQCGFPADISNGTYKLINGTINYLSQVQYSCVEGFKMNGRDRLICDLDERWDGPPPKCTGIYTHYILSYTIDVLIIFVILQINFSV